MTEIRLYNTATRAKQPLRPLDPANVRMYVCGPTVYDRAHIGNARPVVVFDVLYRLLRHVYGENAVTYVRNFTDIDDKINKRAAESRGEGESLLDAARRITDETIGWYREDMAALGALPPTHEPRATEHVPGMIAMIEALIAKKCAYPAEGHVLFEVAKWPAYGSLSRRPLDEMESGARVEVAPYKRNPLDFVLWKPSDETLPGWDSPWGRGRPGWHIECSVMAKALLGTRFDIHGGGIDLAFPHHENELAQSCCANDTPEMASIWMHNGFLQVEGEKMAKSVGNFFTVKDVLDEYARIGFPEFGLALRLRLLMSRYREPLDWTQTSLEEAAIKLSRYSTRLPADLIPEDEMSHHVAGSRFEQALLDDLNTPLALAEIDFELAGGPPLPVVNPSGFPDATEALTKEDTSVRRAAAYLQFLGLPVGELWKFNPNQTRRRAAAQLKQENPQISKKVEHLISVRDEARKQKNYERADSIRDTLAMAGVLLKDTPQGVEWELAPAFDAAKLEALQ